MEFMRKVSWKVAVVACGAALLAASGAALAVPGKSGLWQITVTMGGNDAARMQSGMANVPPQYQAMVQEQMKAHGVTMGGNSISVQQCMTSDAFAVGKPPPVGAHDKNCTMTNMSYTGSHMSADMTCTGTNASSGHVDFSWDSGDHFTGDIKLTAMQGSQTVTHEEKLEGHLISATCH
jgi:Protein of unknown function (DUF3617)